MGGIHLALEFLNTRDPLERSMYVELCDRVSKRRTIMDRNLAIEIADQVSKLIG